MREIKFRAWHEGRMVYWKLFRSDDTYLLDEATTIDEDTDPIMQYTGLKDKRGQEIYEGDYLRWEYPAGFSLAEIKFGMYDNGEEYEDYIGGYGWYIVEYSHYHRETTVGIRIYGFDRYPLDVYEHEVIGNIYENPELLEED